MVGVAVDHSKAILHQVALSGNRIEAGLQTCSNLQAVGDVAGAALLHHAVGAAEDDTLFGLQRTVIPLAVDAVVGIAVVVHEAVANTGQSAGLLVKVHPYSIFGGVLNDGEVAEHLIASVIDVDLTGIGIHPLTNHDLTGPVVTDAAAGLVEGTLHQSASIIEGIGFAGYLADTGMGSEVRRIEIVVVIAYSIPAGNQLAQLGIEGLAVLLQHAGVGGLTLVEAVLTKVVVNDVHLLHAGQLHALFVVGEAALFVVPAFLQGVL